MKIHKRLSRLYDIQRRIKKRQDKAKKTENEEEIQKLNQYYTKCKKFLKTAKSELCAEFLNTKLIRELNPRAMNKYNVISVFDSSLTRTIGLNVNELYDNILIVQTYFFDVIEDIIIDGFIYNSEKYICLTASAGQIRTKKTLFIKEDVYEKHKNTITCGLTVDIINAKGGINVNKYLAYLALSNSATDVWSEFDIRKSIVVEDFETIITTMADFIDDETYDIKRKPTDIPITHTDGCGMMLSGNNLMARLPWIKGLMVNFRYDSFIIEANEKYGLTYGIIKDIYGKTYDILKDDIQYIFTKSQFKAYKYYDSWQDYINKFEKYSCQACKCNEEEEEFTDAKINYQMLQTLNDLSNEELIKISEKTRSDIQLISSDIKTMMKVLGATKSNYRKNHLQQAIFLYPELLNDTYSKEVLKQVKKSIVKNARAGRLEIDGKYTFIIPDLYAFCEKLFLGIDNPKGLLKNNEVYCNLFENKTELNCLRSPHLYREWALRTNIIDEESSKWFTTKGLYTSCFDPISKILQFDVDGDKSLVCADTTLVEASRRNMKDIVPLYYNMRKADAQIINNKTIYEGLRLAYTGGNIGALSNDITKIWNSNDVNLDVVKLLCMENNFTIDYAKTLYKPTRPKQINKLITSYTKSKVPHFFKYAKDKEVDKIEKLNSSVVNRLEKIIPNPRLKFNLNGFQKFDYKNLLNDKNIKLDSKAKKIIEKYTELDLNKRFMVYCEHEEDSSDDSLFLYKQIRDKLLEINDDVYFITDVLVEHLYSFKNSNYKTTLWSSFGDILVRNLKRNIIEPYSECERCEKFIRKSSNKSKYCTECAKEVERIDWAERKRKQREKENVTK